MLIADAAGTDGGIGGTIFFIVIMCWFFGVFDRLADGWDALVNRIHGGGKISGKDVKALRQENAALKVTNADMERLLARIQIREEEGLLALPTDIGEAIDDLLELNPAQKKKELPK